MSEGKKEDSSTAVAVSAGTGSGAARQRRPTVGLPYHRSITGGQLSSGRALRGIASEDNLNVAWVTLGVFGAEERLAFIVRACNAHDELVAALRDVMEALRIHAPGTPLNNHRFDALGMKAYAALALAEPSST